LIKTLSLGTVECPSTCTPKPEVKSILDKCYICDGFCISDPESPTLNSHMLSLYVDLLMTALLLIFKGKREDEFEELKLDSYFISTKKIWSIAGHGSAHLGLSLIKSSAQKSRYAGMTAKTSTFALLLISHFVRESDLLKVKKSLGILGTKGDDEDSILATNRGHTKSLNKIVAPFLAPIVITQTLMAGVGSKQNTTPIWNYLIFGGAAFVFFVAGNPPNVSSWYSAIAAVMLTLVSDRLPKPDNPLDFGAGFVLIFTSAYVYSAIAQMFFWDKEERRKAAVPYAITSWASGLLTTLVGWALALRCSALKEFGGHVLYDLSIPLSYFIIYYLTANWKK